MPQADITPRPGFRSPTIVRKTAEGKAALLLHAPPVGFLQPSEDMTEAEVAVWEATTREFAPGWFEESSRAALEQYCRTVILLRQVRRRARRVQPKDFTEIHGAYARVQPLLKFEKELAHLLCVLETKLRIAPSTRLDRNKNATQHKQRPKNSLAANDQRLPWES